MSKKRMRINSPSFSDCICLHGKGQFLIALFFCFLFVSCSQVLPVAEEKKDPSAYIGAALPEVQSVGLQTLKNGGNAADAATAMLFMQAVHLPSRAGLGAGGVCQVFNPSERKVQTLNFLPTPIAQDIGVPSLARALFSLQNNYGTARWADLLFPAQKAAENGISVSKQLAEDAQKAAFLTLTEEEIFRQSTLAQTLKKLAVSGSGILYKGTDAEKIAKGRSVDLKKLAAFKATWTDSIEISSVRGKSYFPNLAIFGAGAYPIWENLIDLDSAEKYKAAKDELKKLDEQAVYVGESIYGSNIIAVDTNGMTVICSVTMGNVFGSGKEVSSLGFYLPESIDETKFSAHLLNLLQTNSAQSEMTYALSVIGDYALHDGMIAAQEDILNLRTVKQSLAVAQKHLPVDRKAVLNHMPVLSCRNGALTHPASCNANDLVKSLEKEER